jgi:hypothetical protein
MTELEDKVRAAINAKASQVAAGTVPPLHLPVRRRRLGPLVRGGGRRAQAPGRRRWLAAAAAAVATTAVIAAAVTAFRVTGQNAAADTAWNQAAQWVTSQVSPAARVACDPVMCQALAARGLPASRLVRLRADDGSPAGSQVIVVTPAARRELGSRLSSFLAPAVLASFGSGPAQVQVRPVAPNGASAYRVDLEADLQARKYSGADLLDSSRLSVSAAARRQLRGGQVDARLLVMIAALAAMQPVSIVAFTDSGPGASTGIPFRSVTVLITGHGSRSRAARRQSFLTFLHSQQVPFRPAQTGTVQLPRGQTGLRIQFTAPNPLGLLGTSPP